MRFILAIFLLFGLLFAKDITKTPPLKALVINVPKGDVLNIRAKPSYRSKKVFFLKNSEVVSVNRCIKVSKKSTWCNIEPFGFFRYKDSNFGRNIDSGWVNAKYLKPIYKTYASVEEDDPNAEGVSCVYVLNCKNKICNILNEVSIKRSKLKAFDPYGGYCDYIALPWKFQKYKDLRFLVLDIQKWTNLGYVDKMKQRIHPKNGILITYYTTFARFNKHFSASSFAKFYENGKKIYWGVSEGRGDKIYLSLEEFFSKFHNVNAPYKDSIKRVNLSRYGFPNPKGKVAYKIKSLHKDNSWVDMVVVLQKYKEHYYVVGILFDRWSI